MLDKGKRKHLDIKRNMIFFCETQKEYAGLFHAIKVNGDWDCQTLKLTIKDTHSYKVFKNNHKSDLQYILLAL